MCGTRVSREFALGAHSDGGNATKHLPMGLSAGLACAPALSWSVGTAGALGLAAASPRWIARYGAVPRGLALKVGAAALTVAVIANLVMPPGRAWIGMGLGVVLLTLAIIDLVALRLPDVLTLPLICGGLVDAAILGGDLPLRASAAAGGFACFVALDAAYRRLRGRSGLGRGDAKLFAAAGAWLGPAALPTLVLWACACAIILLSAKILRSGLGAASRPLPFGPPLCAAFWMLFLLRPAIAGPC